MENYFPRELFSVGIDFRSIDFRSIDFRSIDFRSIDFLAPVPACSVSQRSGKGQIYWKHRKVEHLKVVTIKSPGEAFPGEKLLYKLVFPTLIY